MTPNAGFFHSRSLRKHTSAVGFGIFSPRRPPGPRRVPAAAGPPARQRGLFPDPLRPPRLGPRGPSHGMRHLPPFHIFFNFLSVLPIFFTIPPAFNHLRQDRLFCSPRIELHFLPIAPDTRSSLFDFPANLRFVPPWAFCTVGFCPALLFWHVCQLISGRGGGFGR